MKVLVDVHQILQVEGQPTVLVSDDYLTVIDTGSPGDEGHVLRLIRSLGRRASDLRHILITHSDLDHVGGLGGLVAESGALVYASAAEAAVIDGDRPTRDGDFLATDASVDRVVRDDYLPLHGGIRVIETPGHTVGHTSYLLERLNLLVAGDCLRNATGLVGSNPEYTFSERLARNTVRKLAHLAPDSICFGHGMPIVATAAEPLRALAELM